jgi:hypothetical protein
MLPAIGASLALDTIQSLFAPQPASSPAAERGFDVGAGSSASSRASATLSGFSSTQISSDNLNALLDAQSLASGDLASALGSGSSTSDPSQGQSGLAPGTASSAYSAVNQLAQTTAIPLGLSVSA